MALPSHDASDGEERSGAKTKFVGAENRGKDDVAGEFQASVHAERESRTEARANQCVMCFAQTNFPRKTGVFDGGQRRGAGSAVVPADGDDVGARFGNARSDDADSGTGYKLYADAGARVHGAKVVDQVSEVLDAVNIVVWRRRNQRRAWGGVADARDVFADLLRGQLAAFARFRALGHFDFKFLGVDEIIGGDSEAAGGDLLDFVGRGGLEAIGLGIFAAFAGIAAATELIHREREGAVGFRAEGAKRHGLGGEALDHGFEGLDFVEWDGRVWNGVEQIAQKDGTLLLRQFFKCRIGLRSGCAHVGVKTADDFGRAGVKFGSLAETVKTGIGHFIGIARED